MPEAALHLRPLPEIASAARSAADTVRSCMAAIVTGDSGPGRVNAFVSYDYETALGEAERADSDPVRGSRLPLRGVPIAIKDNICTLGLPTTCASRMLAGYRSPYEATVVRRLRGAGAIVAGKTNLDEFAMGTSTATSAFGPTRNPHDHTRVPGGSSGGSAAAVAAGMVPVALGSDTGGSIRQPAAFCGVVGVRPTYGRVSRYGLVAFASSLDQIGVLARSVADAARVLDVIAGADARDATCAPRTDADARALRPGVVGVPREYFEYDLHPGVRAACERALDTLRACGCTVRPVSLPHTRSALAAYAAITAAEASSNLARFDGVRFGTRVASDDVAAATRTAGFGPEVRRRIMLGTYLLAMNDVAAQLNHARRVRALIASDFEHVFAGVDVLFTPTTPGPAFRADQGLDPYGVYASDVFTAPASLAGVPAMTVPIGAADALPVGGQIIAPRWREQRMLEFASMVERGTSP
ncbi:MAG TPA: Asp-tRNA(Asn)/Glu-tRNA(Gln) amidotransferase subunit GatA [Longimicrobiales bacterium]